MLLFKKLLLSLKRGSFLDATANIKFKNGNKVETAEATVSRLYDNVEYFFHLNVSQDLEEDLWNKFKEIDEDDLPEEGMSVFIIEGDVCIGISYIDTESIMVTEDRLQDVDKVWWKDITTKGIANEETFARLFDDKPETKRIYQVLFQIKEDTLDITIETSRPDVIEVLSKNIPLLRNHPLSNILKLSMQSMPSIQPSSSGEASSNQIKSSKPMKPSPMQFSRGLTIDESKLADEHLLQPTKVSVTNKKESTKYTGVSTSCKWKYKVVRDKDTGAGMAEIEWITPTEE